MMASIAVMLLLVLVAAFIGINTFIAVLKLEDKQRHEFMHDLGIKHKHPQTWVKPAGATAVQVTLRGGAGGGSSSMNVAGGGGAGGAGGSPTSMKGGSGGGGKVIYLRPCSFHHDVVDLGCAWCNPGPDTIKEQPC
jgi:hypothetical protein